MMFDVFEARVLLQSRTTLLKLLRDVSVRGKCKGITVNEIGPGLRFNYINSLSFLFYYKIASQKYHFITSRMRESEKIIDSILTPFYL